MSIKAVSWALDDVDEVEDPITLLVLIALADEADSDGLSCRPGLRRIAARARCHDSTARRHIDLLAEAGIIVALHPPKQGRGHFNVYGLCINRSPQETTEILQRDYPKHSPRKGSLSATLPEEERVAPVPPFTEKEGSRSAPLSEPEGLQKGRALGDADPKTPLTKQNPQTTPSPQDTSSVGMIEEFGKQMRASPVGYLIPAAWPDQPTRNLLETIHTKHGTSGPRLANIITSQRPSSIGDVTAWIKHKLVPIANEPGREKLEYGANIPPPMTPAERSAADQVRTDAASAARRALRKDPAA